MQRHNCIVPLHGASPFLMKYFCFSSRGASTHHIFGGVDPTAWRDIDTHSNTVERL